MVDTPTARFGARKQSLGSNVNTWGDTKLNDVIDLFDRGTRGYEAVALTGDLTLTWTSYATTNQGQVQNVKFTGSLSASATVTVPSKEWSWCVVNAAGNTVTVKTSAGTGVAIPASRTVLIYCDGTDVYTGAPNHIANYVATLVNAGDVVVKTTLETAIASANIPASAGTLLNSVADTTAGYLSGKTTLSVGSLTTTQVSGLQNAQLSTKNSGANEKLKISLGQGYVEGFLPGGTQALQFTPAQGTAYPVDCSSVGITINLGGMSNVMNDQTFKITCFGAYAPFFLGTVNFGGISVTNISGDPGFSGTLTRTPNGWG